MQKAPHRVELVRGHICVWGSRPRARGAAGLTQKEIAATAGVSRRTVIEDLKSESAELHIEPTPVTNSENTFVF